ncbi:ankyrin repeat protein [Silvibacterium bohemicum]|uniref:Ankyrin repeat protein n=1 Tax=Silvibacterium bohemicum TaxID=1577686 RepID=A0A841JX85_9BACT|nr:ankyrin repeat domain-containing protein [Silvibacterium bohemicum]MBB6145760.1 ankyrin repeat protein [Silvibacterium bohemicum]
MSARKLPSRPSLEQYKKQAKDLLLQFKNLAQQPKPLDYGLVALYREFVPRLRSLTDSEILRSRVLLTDAQFILAQQYGFASWPKFAKHIESASRDRSADPVEAFLEAACVPVNGWHGFGTLDTAEAIISEHPLVATNSIYATAALGDEAGVRSFLALDTGNATSKGGPHGWDALTYLCFSKYLRLDRAHLEKFVRAAQALLDAGATANTGWFDNTGQPKPHWESAIYGAAGIARHPELTQLLLERGADPNDEETPYHVPETYNNRVMEILVESGKLTEESMTTLLLRKTDWHDAKGIEYLLQHGADPSRMTRWQNSALHHALRRDNGIGIIDLLLDHGADPELVSRRDGRSAYAIAARRGRADVLASFERRGMLLQLDGVDRLIAACAKSDLDEIRSLAEHEPELVGQLRAQGGALLAEFAANDNAAGVRQLLDLGIDVAERYKEGDPYYEIAKDSTALHFAAWRMRHATVALLIERGAPVDAHDGRGRTPLALAVRACVDSYWRDMRSPESVRMLLEAGASTHGIDFPSGYAEADELLLRYREQAG